MKIKTILLLILSLVLLLSSFAAYPAAEDDFDSSPPNETHKLIFIHHSCGENWLSDDNGGLGTALGENNYFVSDTNYGWGPNGIGDTTDIPDWLRWFRSDETPEITEALFNEFSNDWYGWEYYQRPMADPGGENEIILFKSCYPNSELWGNPDDPAGTYADLTVAGAKYVYNDLIHFFNQHPDKLFIVITAPPNLNRETAENARAFNDWLVNDWLMPYSGTNVAVWDFYAVLSHKDNHHRFINGEIEYTNSNGNGTAAYDSWGDPHPSEKGNTKATDEFIPMLNIYVNRWLSGSPAHVFPAGFEPELENPEEEITVPDQITEELSPTKEDTPQDYQGFGAVNQIDDFDGDLHWEAYSGDTSVIDCLQTDRVNISEPYSLEIIADVPAGDWASCEYYFDHPLDFSDNNRLSFHLYSDTFDYPFAVLIYSGDPEEPELYGYDMMTTNAQYKEWQIVQLSWDKFEPVWSETGNIDPTRVEGIVFAFGAEQDITGTIAIENLEIYNLSDSNEELYEAEDIMPEEETSLQDTNFDDIEEDGMVLAIREQICGGIFLLPLFPLLFLLLKKKH